MLQKIIPASAAESVSAVGVIDLQGEPESTLHGNCGMRGEETKAEMRCKLLYKGKRSFIIFNIAASFEPTQLENLWTSNIYIITAIWQSQHSMQRDWCRFELFSEVDLATTIMYELCLKYYKITISSLIRIEIGKSDLFFRGNRPFLRPLASSTEPHLLQDVSHTLKLLCTQSSSEIANPNGQCSLHVKHPGPAQVGYHDGS